MRPGGAGGKLRTTLRSKKRVRFQNEGGEEADDELDPLDAYMSDGQGSLLEGDETEAEAIEESASASAAYSEGRRA